jgi:hypothetical protein
VTGPEAGSSTDPGAYADLLRGKVDQIGTVLADLGDVIEDCPAALPRLHLRNLRFVAEATVVALQATVTDLERQVAEARQMVGGIEGCIPVTRTSPAGAGPQCEGSGPRPPGGHGRQVVEPRQRTGGNPLWGP